KHLNASSPAIAATTNSTEIKNESPKNDDKANSLVSAKTPLPATSIDKKDIADKEPQALASAANTTKNNSLADQPKTTTAKTSVHKNVYQSASIAKVKTPLKPKAGAANIA